MSLQALFITESVINAYTKNPNRFIVASFNNIKQTCYLLL